MNSIMEFMGIVAVDKTIEKKNNEIKIENFFAQAKSKNILTKIPNCIETQSSIFVEEIYYSLYDYLILKKIILQKSNFWSFVTFDYVETITPKKDNLTVENLRNIINNKNDDYPVLLKCYNINYEQLSNFLMNYNYNPADEIHALANFKYAKGGRNGIKKKGLQKNKKRITRKKPFLCSKQHKSLHKKQKLIL